MRSLLDAFNDFKSGDTNAFIDIVENKYINSIIKSASGKTPYYEEDEIINEIYIMVTNRMSNLTFNSSRQVTTYLNKAIHGLVKNLSDKKASQQYRECEFKEALQYTFQEDESLEENDINSLLMDTPFLRERILEDKTYQQIASNYGVTVARVYRETKKNEEKIRELLKR